MKKNTSRFLSFIAVLLSVAACNLYQPFNADTSDQDHLEQAAKCLDDGDYSCAVAEYKKLSDPLVQNQNLCELYIAQSGFTLDALINLFGSNSSSVNQYILGSLAQAMLPWSADKNAAASNAIVSCQAYANAIPSSDKRKTTAVLLSSLSYFTQCASLISKTNSLLGSAVGDTACTTPGPGTGTINKTNISSSKGVMCDADAIQCASDVQSINVNSIQSVGLTNVYNAIHSVPPGLLTTGEVATAYRAAIQAAISN